VSYPERVNMRVNCTLNSDGIRFRKLIRGYLNDYVCLVTEPTNLRYFCVRKQEENVRNPESRLLCRCLGSATTHLPPPAVHSLASGRAVMATSEAVAITVSITRAAGAGKAPVPAAYLKARGAAAGSGDSRVGLMQC